MKLLSIDVGIRNLAFILFDFDLNNIKIINWDIINLIDDNCKCKDINLIDLGININKLFKIYFKDLESNIKILIENQIGNNAIRMKCIQGMLSQWFIDNNFKDIEYISSSHKLNFISKIYDLKDTIKDLDYKNKKKMAILILKSFLKENKNYFDDFYLNYFNNNKKKDDLADCFLQGFYYIKKNDLFVNKLIINAYDLKL